MPREIKLSSAPESIPTVSETSRQPLSWQGLFSGGEGSGLQAVAKVRIVQRSGRPFLILPADFSLASQALALYPAQTFRARLARFSLALALKLKLPVVPRTVPVPISCEEPFAAYLSQCAGGRAFPRFAILSGNPKADGRRFVILLFNGENQPVAVVKAGIGESAIRLIAHEASFLTAVPPGIPGPPRLRSTFRSPRVHALALDFIAGDSPRPDDDTGFESLLISWIDPKRTTTIRDLPAWQTLAEHPGPRPAGWQRLENAVCHPAIYHGDFAPWNIKLSDGAWQALDWERGELIGMPAWDWFHYVIQSAVLIKREPVERLAVRVETLLASEKFVRYAGQAGIAGIERMLVLAYLIYAIEVLKQTEELPRIRSLLDSLSRRWDGKEATPASQNQY